MLRPAAPASADAPLYAEGNQRARRPWLGGTAVLAGIALVCITFAQPSATRMHTWPWSFVVTLAWLYPLALLAIGLATERAWRLPPPLLGFGVILLAGACVASAASSPFASASLPRVWPTLGGAALLVVLHHLCTAPEARDGWTASWLPRLLAFTGAALVLVAFAGWWNGTWPLPWSVRNAVPFGHSTYTAGAMVLFLPWTALEAARSRGLKRLAWAAVLATGLLVIVSTSSRGGALGAAFAALIAATGLVCFASWSVRSKLTLVTALFILGGIVIATNPRLRDLVLHRRWSEAAEESNVQRRAMMDAGRRLGSDRPIIGWGPGTVPLAYPRVRAELDGGVDNVLQLHTTPLQMWATTGALGSIALLFLIIGTVVAAVQARRTAVTLAAAASLGGYGLVALTDHQLDLPVVAAAVVAAVVALMQQGRAARTVTPSRRLRVVVAALLLALVGVAAPATSRDLLARFHYDAALRALEEGSTAEFYSRLDQATAAAPHDPYFEHQHAAHLLESRYATRDSARQLALAREAVTRLERSLPGAHEEFAHFNLGWLAMELGDPRRAVAAFTSAAHLVPDKGGVYFGLGLAHQALGNRAAAVRAFALEWINDPLSCTAPAWEIPALAAVVPEIRAETVRLLAQITARWPPAGKTAPWIRWWIEAAASDDGRGHDAPTAGFSGESALFASSLPAIDARAELPERDARWARAYAAWRRNGNADTFLPVGGGDARFAAALARRATRFRTSFPAFIAGPAGEDPALVRTLRRERPGYGVLALHPEGPRLRDVFIVQENRAATELGAGLFPRKGWLPGRFLLGLLPGENQ